MPAPYTQYKQGEVFDNPTDACFRPTDDEVLSVVTDQPQSVHAIRTAVAMKFIKEPSLRRFYNVSNTRVTSAIIALQESGKIVRTREKFVAKYILR